jgi:hypothetical protein
VHRLVLLLVAACAAPTQRPIDNRAATAPMALEITLSRTECFGSCPIYSVTIHGDGRVDWRGEKFVEAKGERHASIIRSQLDALVATIDRVGFFQLDEFGTPPRADHTRVFHTCSDTPSAIVTVVRNGQHHTTSNDHCNPSPATELEDQIEAVIQTARWIGAVRHR